jgi:hypothetical protein
MTLQETPVERRYATVRQFALGLPEGWFYEDDILEYRRLIRSLPDGASMVEVGVWFGRSLCAVADLILSKRLRVTGVDTFRGVVNQSFAYGDDPADRTEAECRLNLRRYGLDAVTLVRGWSVEVAQASPDPIDLVFIDADHEEPSVRADIQAWLPRTRRLLCGHDYDARGSAHPGVKTAVDAAFPDRLRVGGTVWSVAVGDHGW